MYSSKYLDELDEKASAAEKSLLDYFSTRKFDAPDEIVESMKYSLFSPGKKLRPILVREFASIFGEKSYDISPLADAIEMIHTYSLIHDDLPAMDDAQLRRGKASNHIAYSEPIAILAGDGLLNLAFERALEGLENTSTKYYINALKELFNASGIDGMVGGQTADIQGDGDLEYIESHKTGALLKAAVLCGALPFMDKDNTIIESLTEYARAIGRAFQIYDDILDVVASSDQTGKDTGLDAKNETITFVSLYGVDRAYEYVEQLRETAHNALDKIGIEKEAFIRFLTDYICGKRS